MEKRFHRALVSVVFSVSWQNALTYIADADQIDDSFAPTTEYLRFITRGAERFALSEAYRQRLEQRSTGQE
jgi:hypothetical protein